MFKKFVLYTALIFASAPAAAQMPYLDEMRALGTVSGQGLVCGAAKYDQFEMLARAIMLTKAPDNATLQKGAYAYTEAKASVYMNKRLDGGYLCREIASRFNEQDIFKISLYEDGTIKMPDGTIITPKMPYDARKIYKKDNRLKANLKSIYDGAAGKAQARVLKRGGKVSSSAEGAAQMQTASLMPQPAAAYRPQPLQPVVPYQANAARVPASASPAARTVPDDSPIGHISRRSSGY